MSIRRQSEVFQAATMIFNLTAQPLAQAFRSIT
jgi:hypothetical protein